MPTRRPRSLDALLASVRACRACEADLPLGPRPVLQALQAGGRAGAEAFLDRVEAELRTAMLLCGAGTLDELRNAPRVLGPELSSWIGTS